MGLWERLGQRSRLVRAAAALVFALVVGGGLVIAGAAGLAWTDAEEFCIGCHEMRIPLAEAKDAVHDKNRSGVRASCPDCHVPREPVALILRKMEATSELWGHLRGVIDTPEKYEKNRYAMAVREWTRMKKNGSQACRSCHRFESMDGEKQSERAREQHAKARTEDTACIDCHFGIAHREPDGPGPREIKVAR